MKRLLLVAFLLLLPTSVFAQITHVNDIYRQDTVDTSPTCTITGTTSGNGLIISFLWHSSSATLSSQAISGETVTPFTNGSYTNADLGTSGKLFYVKNLASGGSKTVTATLSSSVAWTCAIMEISGQNTTNFDDGSGAVQTAQFSANPSTNITTTVNNAFLYSIVNTGEASTVGAGFTATAATWSTFDFPNNAEYKADAGTAGTTAVVFSMPNDRWNQIVVAVRGSGGAPSPTLRHRVIQ